MALLLPAVTGLTSCSDDSSDFHWFDSDDDSEQITVGASIRGNIHSRGYKDAGVVDEGDYYLTYPMSQRIVQGDTTYTYDYANVHFGTVGAEKMGFVTYTGKDGKLTDLKWSDVNLRKGGTAVFYLDNVSPDLNDQANEAVDYVLFRQGEEIPYSAGVFDNVNGSNDLLWGRAEAANNTKMVNFTLHHNMARLRVVITVLPREDNKARVDLFREATLEITGLQQVPEGFDRTTGNLVLPLNPERTPLTVVNIDNSEQENNGAMIWADRKVDTVTSNGKEVEGVIYTTQDFVLPPQELPNDGARPTLCLTVPAKYARLDPGEPALVYEAFLPQNMYAAATGESEEEVVNRPPMPLSFMKEHVLTIRATVGPPEMELEFAPVYLEDWTDMGEYSVEGQQAGIYTNQDFMDFLECYKEGDTELLGKYGYTSGTDADGNPKWIIMFWSRAIDLPKEKIENALDGYMDRDPKIPFSFSFNNYVIKVNGWGDYSELSGAAGQIRLYNLITGLEEPLPGITTLDDFKGMITAYGNSSTSGMQKYGAYDNTNERWEFEFTQNAADVFEVEYEVIRGKMKDNLNFIINFRGHTVKVKNIPGVGDKELTGDEGATLLHAMLIDPPGIYSLDDVALLAHAYDPDVEEDLSWILQYFGEGDGTLKYTFRRSMQMDGPEIYGSMVADASRNLPDYTFAYASGETVKVGDGSYVYTYTDMNLLKKLFSAGGRITTVSELSNAITYANNGNPVYRRYYGVYLDTDRIWDYPVNGTFTVNYNDIFGKVTSTDVMKASMVGESKVTVTGLPGGLPDIICRGQQGADILTAILRGTYKLDNLPEPGIETPGDFAGLAAAYNANSADLLLYGNRDESAGLWTFVFTPTAPSQIEVDYAKIYNTMNGSSSAGDFIFDFGERTVKVTNLPNGGDITLSGSEGATLLHAIVTARGTVDSLTDLQWLINAYNAKASLYGMLTLEGDQDWILDLYGTKSGDSRSFTVGRSMQWQGADIYGKMVPDITRGKPAYSFNYASGSGIQVLDGTHTENVTPGNLTRLLSNGGKVSSATELADLAASGDNPVKQRYYGTVSGTTWTYPVTTSMSVDYNAIFNKIAYAFNITLADGVTVNVTGLPAGFRPISCTGTSGATTLKSLLDGSYRREAAGIKDLQDVADLITAYNANNTNNMAIYGDNNGGTWTFNFLASLTLEGNDIYGAMVPGGSKPDYNFNTDSYTVHVSDGDPTATVTAANLKTLFSNGGKIASATDLTALIDGGNNLVTRRYYGTTDGSSWTFPVTESFDIAYNSVFGLLKGYDYNLTLGSGVTINITNLPQGFRPISCTGSTGAVTLKSLLDGSYKPLDAGIYNAQDFTALLTAYSGNDAEAMYLYGSRQGSAWTFTFRNSAALTLTGTSLYGKMVPGTSYSFVFSGGDVKVSDGVTTETVTAANLTTLLSNSGKITSAADLTSMLAAASNPVKGRYYGTLTGGTLTCPVTASFSVAYDDIKGKLATGATIAFTMGATVTVTDVPGADTTLICSGTEGAALLLSIANDSYVPRQPDPDPEPEPGGGDTGDGGTR